MPDTRPLTTQEIDDGWQLDDIAPPQAASAAEDPYEEYLLGERPSSALEQAFWEQHEDRKLTHLFDEVPSDFGKGRRVRGTLPPPADLGN